MGLTASVVDGQIQESSSAASLANASGSSKTASYDQDTFLQLLVAEVQNQDPLEPTSNTEWVSQYATFSELESMNNMSASYELSRASALVGKIVQLKVTDSSGTSNVYQGKVDYVTYEENKAYVSVNGSLYSLSDVYNVIDSNYIESYETAYKWASQVASLPATNSLTLDDQETVEDLYEQYQEMSSYTQEFIDDDTVELIKADYAQIQILVKQKEAAEAEAAAKAAEEAAQEAADAAAEAAAEALTASDDSEGSTVTGDVTETVATSEITTSETSEDDTTSTES